MLRLVVPSLLLAATIAAAGQQQRDTATVEMRGRVVDASTGAPIAGAAIQAWPSDASMLQSSRRAQTDASGAFTVTGIGVGEYQISASRPGYLGSGYGRKRPNGGGIPLLVSANQAPAPFTISMWRAASIAGRVLDERGRPAVEVPVSALAVDDTGGRRVVRYGPAATTNDLGEYWISNVVPGRYIVAVPAHLDTRRLATKVYKRSDPVTWNQTILLDDDSAAAMPVAAGLLPPPAVRGRRTVYVSSFYGGTRVEDAAIVEVTPGADVESIDVDLTLRPAVRVSGTIAGSAGPVSGATISLRPLDWGGPRQVASVTAFAGEDGAFVFLAVPPGRYVLTALRNVPTPGPASFSSNGSVGLPMDDVIDSDPEDLHYETTIAVGDSDISDLAITMTAGTKINGRIFFTDAAVLNDRQFSAFRVALRDLGREMFEAGRSGSASRPDREGVVRFSIQAQPGEYTVGAAGDGWWLESARVDGRDVGIGPFRIGQRDVEMEVTLTRTPTELSGAVADPQGRPVVAANVVIFPVEPALWRVARDDLSWHLDGPVRSLRTGRSTYVMAGLPPGEYFVAAIDEADMDGWPSAAFLERTRISATRVQLSPGEHHVVPLIVRPQR